MKIARAYYPIADAAKMIGCTTDVLIHLGANQKLEIWGLFASGVEAERDPGIDLQLGGPDACHGAGPFLLDPRDLKKLEAGNADDWCTIIWQRDESGTYGYWPHVPVSPSRLVIMTPDVGRLRDECGEPERKVEETAATAAPTNGVTLTLPHLPKALDAVFNVMRQNWTDPDPRRLPKQLNIALELDAALGYNTGMDGTPSRNAKAIARIIRPDTVYDTE